VRVVCAAVLIVLIVACPFLCGSGEVGRGPHRREAAGGDPAHSGVPIHCPQDGDECICNGAVKATDVRLPDLDASGVPLPPAVAAPTPVHPIPHLTWNGSPSGLAGQGDSLTVRAFLQNFRC
jgi:hypothetical protein